MKSLDNYIKESILDLDPENYDIIKISLSGKDTISSSDLESIPGIKNLRELILPEGVTTIIHMSRDRDMSVVCPKLTKIVFPSTIKTIEGCVFSFMRSLEEIEFSPDCGVVDIKHMAFKHCNGLKSVHLPRASRIYTEAFAQCSSLVDLTFGRYVSMNGDNNFCNCTCLEKVDMSRTKIDNLTISPQAFAGCTNLREVSLHTTTYEIGSQAFMDCMKLTSIKAQGVWRINNQAFSGCISLRKVVVGKEISIGYSILGGLREGSTFRDCKSLKSIPSTITGTIHNNDFKQCTSLEELTISDIMLQKNGKQLFDGCPNLKVINIVGKDAEHIEAMLRPLIPPETAIVIKK